MALRARLHPSQPTSQSHSTHQRWSDPRSCRIAPRIAHKILHGIQHCSASIFTTQHIHNDPPNPRLRPRLLGRPNSLQRHRLHPFNHPLLTPHPSFPSPTPAPDDVAALRTALQALLASGIEIILVMHSAGAFIGSQAIKDLSVDARTAEGETGGV